MVVVRLLGPVDVIDGAGNVRPPASAIRRTLLALLALRPGEVVSGDWLLEHAWNADPPESGLRALRFHISRLRQELAVDGFIETTPGGYRLAITADQVDASSVDKMAAAVRRDGDRHVAVDMMGEVLAQWRGTPFIDAAPCASLDEEPGRLEQLRLTILEDHFRLRLEAGAGRELVADLSRATTQHPLRESLWSMLITAQYSSGQQADSLRSYETMRTMLAETLGLDPSVELQDLQRRVLQQDPTLLGQIHETLAGSSVRGTLPAPATPLIDTEDQLGSARNLLRDHRLLTLTGAGGIGKSRLAVELGWSCIDEFDAGVWLIELAPVGNDDAVPAAVASTLSIRPQQSSTLVESIVDWLTGRQLLLIVDNCEHVLESVRQLLAVVVARCPTVKVVATSREPLGIAGEHVHRVSVLSPASDGVALFLDRAAAADDSFVASPDDIDAITDICRHLDGLPLAIELAAARIRSMAPVDLLARLDSRFSVLRGSASGASGHHHTLLMTVDWSYQLLTEAEQSLFDRLSVFSGGWDVPAAEAVCDAEVVDVADVIDLLSHLVDKSMVSVERRTDGTRYRLLETLREFGDRRLRERGNADQVRDRHLLYYVDVAEHADDLFRGSQQLVGIATFDREWDNMRAAHGWAITSRNLRMAERLLWASYLYALSRMRFEHGDWANETIALGTDERPAGSYTFAQAAHWAWHSEERESAEALLAQGVDLLTGLDDPGAARCAAALADEDRPGLPPGSFEAIANKLDLDREWWALILLAEGSIFSPPCPRPEYLARLVETAERVAAPSLVVDTDLLLGHFELDKTTPNFAAAREIYTRARNTARQSGDLVAEGLCLRALAIAAVGLGSDDARDTCRLAMVRLYEARHWWTIWQLFHSSALHLALSGNVEAGSVILGFTPKLPPL